ncbi:MAG: hypothetical protein H6747_06800 [Deltaproteobacteria bacterium]|nr:hypothetical protein [Deltaproteobacteria bacterium]
MPELIDAAQTPARGASPAKVVLTEADADLGRRVDFRLLHLTSHRAPLHALVRTLEEGGDLAAIPNLQWQLAGMASAEGPVRVQAHPASPDALRPFAPVLDIRTIGEPRARDGSRPPRRKTLDTNKGCPFSAPIAENPAFSGLQLPSEGVTLSGCSFCFMGGDYKALPWRETVAIHLGQLAYYERALAERGEAPLEEIVLRDQHAIRYLPHLLQGAIERGLRPIGFLVPGRGDAILRYGDALREAAAIAADSGFWFTLYLIGFESFSQPQLDLYNKGVTTAQYAEAIASLRELQRAHPEAFRLTAYGASSFILWNPWTTLDDLDATTRFCRAHDVLPLAHGIGDTRLRLYPHLPLWHKARAEGLLLESADDGRPADAGARWTGYAAATPWLARDGRLAVAEVLATELLRRVRPAAALDAIEVAAAWAWRRFPAPLPPLGREAIEAGASEESAALRHEIAALVDEIDGLRALWRSAPAAAAGTDARPTPPAERTILVGAGCNNACRRCVGEHGHHDDATARLQPRVDAAASSGRVVFAGREPTLVRGLPGLLRRARGAGATDVQLVSNGRALALAGVAEQLAAAGASRVQLKRHRLGDEDEDAYARAAGAGAQQRQGARAASEAGLRLEALLIPVAGAEAELPALVAQAAVDGATAVQVQILLGEVVPERVGALRQALTAAERTAAEAGLRWTIEGF